MTERPADNKTTQDEFAIIDSLFAPLTEGAPEAFGLTDDAACLKPQAGHDLVITKDALVAGVHFLEDDAPGLIARKALRVNLSDLAAKGAVPLGYLMACAWPRDTDLSWMTDFADGLKQDQAEWGLSLWGGDTVSTPGPFTVSITAFGQVKTETMITRSGAQAGDDLYVSGTIGDAGLGLRLLTGDLQAENEAHEAYAIARYRLPQPRLSLGQALVGLASAALDVSDGLVADATHLATSSGVGLEIDLGAVPLSKTAEALGVDRRELVVVGDDYELLFTVPRNRAEEVAKLSRDLSVPVTRIGHIQSGAGVCVKDAEGQKVQFDTPGYVHF